MGKLTEDVDWGEVSEKQDGVEPGVRRLRSAAVRGKPKTGAITSTERFQQHEKDAVLAVRMAKKRKVAKVYVWEKEIGRHSLEKTFPDNAHGAAARTIRRWLSDEDPEFFQALKEARMDVAAQLEGLPWTTLASYVTALGEVADYAKEQQDFKMLMEVIKLLNHLTGASRRFEESEGEQGEMYGGKSGREALIEQFAGVVKRLETQADLE